MIRLLAAGTRIALVAVAMAMSIPVITFAQTPESAIESIPTEENESAVTDASPTGDRTGANNDTSVQRNSPTNSAVPAAVEADNQSRIDELRREILDDRATGIVQQRGAADEKTSYRDIFEQIHRNGRRAS